MKLSRAEYEAMHTAIVANNEPAKPPVALQQSCSTTEDDSLSREELLRRYRNQQVWHRSFAECLDGIPEIRCIPGAGMEGCRMPDEIRRIVKVLVDHCQTTWEFGCYGRAKSSNAEVSDGGGK